MLLMSWISLLSKLRAVSTKPAREVDALFHLCKYLLWRLTPKRRHSLDHLEKEDAERPDVNFMVIGHVLHHFWCHVLVRAAQCFALADNSREAEVAELGFVLFREQDILGLKII